MASRNSQAITIRPQGLSDAVDGSNTFPGAMAVLKDLIPNPSTANQFVPRPASISVYNFVDFNTPAGITGLMVVGTRAYGFVSSARNAGKDEPFVYDLGTGANIAVANVTAANCPTTQPTTGDWTPPTIAMITNGRIVFTHPGYDGSTYMIGWLDISSFSSTTVTGSTHTTTTIDTLSANVLTVAGWQVGYRITGTGIPVNTFITAIAANGLSITISNAATASAAGVALTVTGGTPAAPIYGAGNTAPVGLVSRPTCVQQFNGRAYYGVLNGVAWSDSLIPTQITSATQALTLGDNTAVTALSGLPLTSSVTGGTIQSLIAFKGAGLYYQITGDPTSALTSSAVVGSVGTLAPNTICNTPQGIAYIAPDGLRVLTLSGVCTAPLGANGEGVCLPFLNAINPSRMCMAYNEDTLRVSVQNGNVDGQPVQEYWLHQDKKVWTGPHSFPAALIESYTGGSGGNTFIMAASGVNAKLWQSAVIPSANSVYTENGVAMTVTFQPVLSPDNSQASMNAIVKSMLGLALPPSLRLTIAISNEQGDALDTLVLSGSGAAGSVWNAFNWGAATWGSAVPSFMQYFLPWHVPLVFKQASWLVAGASVAGFVIGNLNFDFERLGYPIQ